MKCISLTYDWYTQDKQGNVWYFGEDTREFKADGKVITKGSWEAGVNGAQPGIIMPAQPKLGTPPYRQEYLVDEAEDMAQVVGLNETVTVPLGTFKNCVKTKEWTKLDAGEAHKWNCRGIGFVKALSSTGEIATLKSVKLQSITER